MGGRALKHLDVKRISSSDFKSRIKMFENIISLYEGVIQYDIPAGISEKQDHGDLDVIFYAENPQHVIEFLMKEFNSKGKVKNGNCNSIEWMGFQVDMIYVAKEKLDFAKNYYAHGTHAALLGRIASYYGFKLGWGGFFKKIHVGNSKKYYELTLNWDKALEFLGYDYVLNHSVDASTQEVFEHIQSSKYFCRNIFKTTKPDRNYGFQEDFYDYVKSLENCVDYYPKQLGWYLLLKHYPGKFFTLAYLQGSELVYDKLVRPIRKFIRKIRYKYLKNNTPS